MNDFDFFHERYRYDPSTGDLYTKYPMHGQGGLIPTGSKAGSVETAKYNYKRIVLSVRRDGKQRMYRAHRVIWLLMTGSYPSGNIDHIDGDATNNRWDNLRIATQSENMANRSKQKNNTSGYKGVSKHGSNWRAQLEIGGKKVIIGTYKTPEEAYQMYSAVSQQHNGEFFHG